MKSFIYNNKNNNNNKTIVSKIATPKRSTSETAWAIPWKCWKESWSQRRTKAPGNWTDKRKFRSICVAGSPLRNCWIQITVRTADFITWVTEESETSQLPFTDAVVNPTRNTKQDRVEKRFSAYWKPTPLFQTGVGLFSTQLRSFGILKKPRIFISIKLTQL